MGSALILNLAEVEELHRVEAQTENRRPRRMSSTLITNLLGPKVNSFAAEGHSYKLGGPVPIPVREEPLRAENPPGKPGRKKL